MTRTMNSTLLLVAGLSFFALAFRPIDAPVTAEKFNGWELLGAKKVDYGLDRDEIKVTAREGVFTALQVRIKRSPVNMQKLVVHYGNGETEDIELRNNFRAGGESRVIDLPGNKRVIRKVVFWYDTKNLARSKALVEIWGRH